ncbi:MAG: D-glycero-beta-D-manno-heptose 1,7-bisphosphate 7-phosphatase [Caldilineaceae bacterium]
MKPAIFLDRDGVINENRDDYVKSWAEFRFLPGALEAIADLARLAQPIVIVTNQSAIGRGHTTHEDVQTIHQRMIAAILDAGGRVDAVLYCPHHPDAQCTCRKPQPGMLLAAAERLHIRLDQSVFVGDAESDILAAQRAGCRPVLVRTGRGENEARKLAEHRVSGYCALPDLAAAVAWIAAQPDMVSVS